MNAACPVCGYHWGANGLKDGQETVPLREIDWDEEPDRYGIVLHFCSEECRDEYITENPEWDD